MPLDYRLVASFQGTLLNSGRHMSEPSFLRVSLEPSIHGTCERHLGPGGTESGSTEQDPDGLFGAVGRKSPRDGLRPGAAVERLRALAEGEMGTRPGLPSS